MGLLTSLVLLIGAGVLTALGAGLLMSAALRQQRSSSQALDHLARSLGGTRVGKHLTGLSAAVEYRAVFRPGRRGAPATVRLEVAAGSAGSFLILKRGSAAGVELAGSRPEFPTGDAAFDHQYRLFTDNAPFTSVFFYTEENRQIADALFRRGALQVAHDGRCMAAEWAWPAASSHGDPEALRDGIAQLGLLGRGMPASLGTSPRAPALAIAGTPQLMLAVPSLLLFAAVGMLLIGLQRFPPLDGGRLFLESLKYNALALITCLVVTARMVRGHPAARGRFATVVGISCLAVPVAGFAVAVHLNGMTDAADVAQHRVEVIEREERLSAFGLSRILRVASWRRSAATEQVYVSAALFEQTKPGDAVMVATKAGRFGAEWVVSCALAPSSAAAPIPSRAQPATMPLRERHALEARVQAVLAQDNVSQRRDIDPVFELAALYAREGRRAEGIALYESALRVDSGRLVAQLQLATLLAQEGQIGEAIEKARLVADYAEDEPLVREAQEALASFGAAASPVTPPSPPTLPPDLILVPMGPPMDTWLVEEVLPELEATLGMRCELANRALRAGGPDRVNRFTSAGQVDAARLIDELRSHMPRQPDDPLKGYLAVTGADLYADQANFLFGLAQPGYGIMSYHRFLARVTGEAPNRPRVRARFLKQAISSTFFILGIPRCTSPVCARAYPHSLTEHDQKGAALCDWCREQLRMALRRPSL